MLDLSRGHFQVCKSPQTPQTVTIPELPAPSARLRPCQQHSLGFCPHCICMRWLTNSTCIFMGQAWSCRYETSVLQSQPKKDWSAAAKHYCLAMSVYPSGDTCHPSSLQALPTCCVFTLLAERCNLFFTFLVVSVKRA